VGIHSSFSLKKNFGEDGGGAHLGAKHCQNWELGFMLPNISVRLGIEEAGLVEQWNMSGQRGALL
jgi:hypothetical protein